MGSKYIKFGDWDTVNGSELGDGYIYLEKKQQPLFWHNDHAYPNNP